VTVRLPPRAILGLLLAGAAGGLVGDAGHVETGTTVYLKHGVPFIWHSAIWFVVGVGIGTVAVAELRLRLGPPRQDPGGVNEALTGIAVVVGIYGLTAVVRHAALLPSTVLICALALITWTALGDGLPALVCAIAAAITGTVVEAILAATDVAHYADNVNTLAGVAPWLPALYFAFGVVAARLGEIGATRLNLR
jgi:hypothetical protein